MPRRSPLLNFTDAELQSTSSVPYTSTPFDDRETPKKRWYDYLPLFGTVSFILAPHPSLLYVLVDFHLQTLHRPILFLTHLGVTYTLTFMAFSSLIVCLARDPGPANAVPRSESIGEANNGEEIGLTEALMPDQDYGSPDKWCRKCWAPRPERAHHCSVCRRCVLKMDHHCPWIGATCIGHRTYPAFVHFLCSVTLLATYVGTVGANALWYAFDNPFAVHELTPVHELIITFAGIIFALVIGPFAAYHLYLISTNQTTLEHIAPFILLRHLPSLPRSGHSLSDPPLEAELNFTQRRLVKSAHVKILLYDVGWKANWSQVFGWRNYRGLLFRIWCGGASVGDGKTFPRNPRSDDMLAKLATDLVKADADRL